MNSVISNRLSVCTFKKHVIINILSTITTTKARPLEIQSHSHPLQLQRLSIVNT